MHRRPLLQLLEHYCERFPSERNLTNRFLAFVREHERCFERSLAPGHVTGSAWIVSEDGSETLLTHHAKLDIWVQPGGHADGESDIRSVALKEAREETGLASFAAVGTAIFDLDIHRIPARRNEPEHDHYDVRFLVRQAGDRSFTVTGESHDLAWLPLDRIEQYTIEPSILRMRDKTREFLRLAEDW